MSTLEKQFEHHFQVIRSSRFRDGVGLGNEVPFFIGTFPPEKQVEVDKYIGILQQRLRNDGIPVILINLFQFCIKLLEQDGVLEDYLKYELRTGKPDFLQALNSELTVESRLAPAILEMMGKDTESMLFISGVGAVYPVIRTHTILTNLQSMGRKQPTILFFPGIYSHKNGVGSTLDLFGKLNEDRYYRAFSLNQYQI